jgi:UDP-GlcNAc:undecaprenyl-phosphate GlcNAc-1-phosphate transferase
MEMGHGQRRSVIILWAWTALLSALVLYPVLTQSFVSYVPIGAAMLGLVLYTMFHPQIRRNRAAPAEIPDVGLESETSPG